MKIAVLAHIRHAIAEPFMGGMEAHCQMLCQQLRRVGHLVTLFAAGGSRDENLVEICSAPYEEVLPWRVWRGSPELAGFQRAAFERAWATIVEQGFDVVHNNSLYAPILDWVARDGMPCVTSQHVPPFGVMREAAERTAASAQLRMTVTSQSQKALWPATVHPSTDVVNNGIRCDQWRPSEVRGDYFTWCGRITPTKGTADAVRAAMMAGVSLKLFGPVEDTAYFAGEVEPFLSDAIEYCGHQNLASLRDYVSRARGAIVTPLWDEPFGLVAAEALASGTPVIAYDNGALREVVGEGGLIVPPGDVAGLATAIGRAKQIDRTLCRARAVKHFSVEAMVAGYEECYRRALDAMLVQATCAFSSSQSRTRALLA
ncbi:MAG: glycosyltransferase [Pseudomonadota bacterium]